MRNEDITKLIEKNKPLVESQLLSFEKYNSKAKLKNQKHLVMLESMIEKINNSNVHSDSINIINKHIKSYIMLNKICEFIFEKKKKKLSEIKKIENDFKELLRDLQHPSIESFSEFKILDYCKFEYYEWRKQVKIEFIKSHNKIVELRNEFNQNNDLNNIHEYQLDELKSKLYKEILNSKITMQRLEQLHKLGENVQYIDLSNEEINLFNEIKNECKNCEESIQNSALEGGMLISSLESALKMQISTPKIISFHSQVNLLIQFNTKCNNLIASLPSSKLSTSDPLYHTLTSLISEGKSLKASSSLLEKLSDNLSSHFIPVSSIISSLNSLPSKPIFDQISEFSNLPKNLISIVPEEQHQLISALSILSALSIQLSSKPCLSSLKSLLSEPLPYPYDTCDLISTAKAKLSKNEQNTLKIKEILNTDHADFEYIEEAKLMVAEFIAEFEDEEKFEELLIKIIETQCWYEDIVDKIKKLTSKEELDYSQRDVAMIIGDIQSNESILNETPEWSGGPAKNMITAFKVLKLCKELRTFEDKDIAKIVEMGKRIKNIEAERYVSQVFRGDHKAIDLCKEIKQKTNAAIQAENRFKDWCKGIRSKAKEEEVERAKLLKFIYEAEDRMKEKGESGDGTKILMRKVLAANVVRWSAEEFMWNLVDGEVDGEMWRARLRDEVGVLMQEIEESVILKFRRYMAGNYNAAKSCVIGIEIENFIMFGLAEGVNSEIIEKFKFILWYLEVEECINQNNTISKEKIQELNMLEPLIHRVELYHRSLNVISRFNELMLNENFDKVNHSANCMNQDLKVNIIYHKINMDETLSKEQIDQILFKLKSKSVLELEEKLTFAQAKQIIDSKNDPRSNDKGLLLCLKETFKKAGEIRGRSIEILHEDPAKIHCKNDIDAILSSYSNNGIVIEQTEILKKMFENSVKIYEQEMSAETIDDILDSVDIKIDEFEYKCRRNIWEQQAQRILEDPESIKKITEKELVKYIFPDKEWSCNQETVDKVKNLYNQLFGSNQKNERSKSNELSDSLIKKENSKSKNRKRRSENANDQKSKKKQKTHEQDSKK